MEFNESWHTVVAALEKIIPVRGSQHILIPSNAEKARIYAVNSARANKTLKDHLQKAFGSVFMIEFLFGAIVVLRGLKSQKG